MHSELNIQNKALLERVKELIDAGDEKDNRIRELEAQVRNTKGNLCSESIPVSLLYSQLAEFLMIFTCDVCRGYSEGGFQNFKI